MTTYNLLKQSCGLSHREAAAYLDVRESRSKDWSAGRVLTPPGVLAGLFELVLRQEAAAEEALAVIEAAIDKHGLPQSIPIGVSVDDHEAQSLGWPCVAAHMAVIRRLIEMLEPEIVPLIEIVPRGSTPETAAAADAHGK